MIILPAIDLRGGRCVRLLQGDYAKETVYSDSPADQAAQWEAQGGELLHLVDLDGAKEGKLVNKDAIRAICQRVKIPCELGGGIRTIDDAKEAFDLGISRIILGTAACESPRIIEDFTKQFGTDRILRALNENPGASPRELLENVHRAVDGFVGDARQFDDLTMLCLEYRGPKAT